MDIELMAQVQALHGRECVFLGTTHDEAGDDVQHTQPGCARAVRLSSAGWSQG
jgi:hypothetical protein